MDDKKYVKNQLTVFNYNFLPWRLRNIPRNMKYACRNIKYAWQRATKGYCDCDLWNLDGYLTFLIAAAIEDLADNHMGYPGVAPVDTDEKWTEMLHTIAQNLKESDECYDEEFLWENPYTKQLEATFDKMTTEKTEDGMYKVNFNRSEEEEEFCNKWYQGEQDRYALRNSKKDKALDLLKTYWFNLWD